MSFIHDVLARIRRSRPAPSAAAPIISTPFGNVTESMRLQACANMNASGELRDRVLGVIVNDCGGDLARAMKEFKRRYPEVTW